MDESKHEIHSQVDAITAGTASMVNLTAGDTLMTPAILPVSASVGGQKTLRARFTQRASQTSSVQIMPSSAFHVNE